MASISNGAVIQLKAVERAADFAALRLERRMAKSHRFEFLQEYNGRD